MTGCVSEKIEFGGPGPVAGDEAGYVAFGEGGLTVITDAEIVRADVPDVDTFLCGIIDERTGASVMSFAYGDRPAEPISLKPGSYRLTVADQAGNESTAFFTLRYSVNKYGIVAAVLILFTIAGAVVFTVHVKKNMKIR